MSPLAPFTAMRRVARGLVAVAKALPQLASPESRGGWYPLIRESFTGAWQSNVEVTLTDVLSHPTAWACITLIASDIGKLAIKLVEPKDGIWIDAESPAFSPVLRKPNAWQIRIKFYEQWIISKLTQGNTYVLKQRDDRRVVVGMFVLDPQRVKPLVSPDGAVWYELKRDDLSGLPEEGVIVPAREIIHDVGFAPFHPLCGISPLYACGIAAIQGLRMQSSTTHLFENGANPGGLLSAPGHIPQDTADRLKAYWDTNFTGANMGKVAILGDGLKFQKMALTAVDTDLIKQLNWTDEKICSAFHVPRYMVGVGPEPTYNNIEALKLMYYSQCLQSHIESIELLLDEGLGTLPTYGTEFDLDNLLRMDSGSQMATIKEGVGAGIFSPDEGRRQLNLLPVKGGDSPMAQQQYYSLAALARRDELAPAPPTPSMDVPVAAADADAEKSMGLRFAAALKLKSIERGLYA